MAIMGCTSVSFCPKSCTSVSGEIRAPDAFVCMYVSFCPKPCTAVPEAGNQNLTVILCTCTYLFVQNLYGSGPNPYGNQCYTAATLKLPSALGRK